MKFFELACVIAILFSITNSKGLKQSKIVKAINCGSKEGSVKSDGDFKYEHDTGLVSGNSIDVDYHSDANAVNA